VLIFNIKAFGGIIFFIIDFYLLLSFAAGYRVSFRVIDSFYNRNSGNKGKKILIYGAGHKGSMLLKEIRHNGSFSYLPFSFVDDDHNKKGRVLHGCPILGSVEDLELITNKNEISEIIISTRKISKKKIKKLKEFCKQKGISIKQFELGLGEIS
jgi:FlaA1/EpsC-like NDP-sugar epimerase